MLDLCKILKGHEGETFYSLAHGAVKIGVIGTNIISTKTKNGTIITFDSKGRISVEGECILYPYKQVFDHLTAEQAWSNWMKDNPKENYDTVAKALFETSDYFQPDDIDLDIIGHESKANHLLNCTSKKQLEKLLAINQLMNVQKYIEKGRQPNWSDLNEAKYFIFTNNNSNINITGRFVCNESITYFSSEENAKKAIKILGEDTIKLALSTDY